MLTITDMKDMITEIEYNGYITTDHTNVSFVTSPVTITHTFGIMDIYRNSDNEIIVVNHATKEIDIYPERIWEYTNESKLKNNKPKYLKFNKKIYGSSK